MRETHAIAAISNRLGRSMIAIRNPFCLQSWDHPLSLGRDAKMMRAAEHSRASQGNETIGFWSTSAQHSGDSLTSAVAE